MPTREEKIAAIRQSRATNNFSNVTREQKIAKIREKRAENTQFNEQAALRMVEHGSENSMIPTADEITKPVDIDAGNILKDYGIEPGIEMAATIKGAQMGSKVPGGPLVKGLATLAGGGLGYAGARQMTKDVREKPLVEKLKQIPEDVATGAAYEAGSQIVAPIFSALRKSPSLIKGWFGKLMAKEPQKGQAIIKSINSADDVLRELRKVEPNATTEEANAIYKEMNLEPLTPAQMQPKVGGQPTPAQMAEGKLRAKDPGLYEQGRKQAESAEKLLEEYRTLGASSPEAAGQQVKEGLRRAKEPIGQEIGAFKEAGKDIRVKKKTVLPLDKQDAFPLSNDDVFSLGSDISEVKGIKALYDKAKTVKDLDNLSSNVGSEIKKLEIAGNSKLARKYREVKTFLEDNIANKIESAGIVKPKDAYSTYSQVKNLENDTLKGIQKTGKSKDVIKKITASGENIDQFKKTAEALKEPGLMTTVKENWLSELFSDPRYRSKWLKVKKEGIAGKLLSKEQVKKIDTLMTYIQQSESTMAKAINPSKSGLLFDMIKNPLKAPGMMVEYVMGDERKYRTAIKAYKKALAKKPGMVKGKTQRSPLPYMYGTTRERE